MYFSLAWIAFISISSDKWDYRVYKYEVWSDKECKNLLDFYTLTSVLDTARYKVEECKAKCERVPECNAFNFYDNQPYHCVLRGCPFPVPHPQTRDDDYEGHFVKGRILNVQI